MKKLTSKAKRQQVKKAQKGHGIWTSKRAVLIRGADPVVHGDNITATEQMRPVDNQSDD